MGGKRIGGIIGRADDLNMEFSQDASGREFRLRDLAVGLIPDLACGLGRDQTVDAEVALQLQMAPMIERISERVGNSRAPCRELFKRISITRAKSLGNTVAAHCPPFIVIPLQPELGQIGKASVSCQIIGRQMTVIVDDRQRCRDFMIKPTGCSGLQKEILVDEAHAVGKFLQERACDVACRACR